MVQLPIGLNFVFTSQLEIHRIKNSQDPAELHTSPPKRSLPPSLPPSLSQRANSRVFQPQQRICTRLHPNPPSSPPKSFASALIESAPPTRNTAPSSSSSGTSSMAPLPVVPALSFGVRHISYWRRERRTTPPLAGAHSAARMS